jgi:hypothetical protein
MSNGNESGSVNLKPFDNWVTVTIVASIITVIGFGILLIITSQSTTWWFGGIGMTCLGALAWIYGLTEFPENPPTAGALFCWNIPILSWSEAKKKKIQIVVGGKTVLANYFPFYISAVPIDISNKNKEFPVSVLSDDNVTLTGKVSVTARPDGDDIQDYIQAGGTIEEGFEQIRDIIATKSREHAREHNQKELMSDGQLIGKKLKLDIEQGSFGIHIFKVNVVMDPPEDVKKVMQGIVIEKYQRLNELAEYATNLKAAQELQDAYENDEHRSANLPVPSLRDCIEEILEQRLIRDGKATGIKNKGGTTINIPKV